MSKSSTMDIEMGRPNANTASAHGREHHIQEVNEFLGNTANMVRKLKEANQEFNSATGSAAMKEIKGRMDEDIDEVGKMAQIMKEKLRKMNVDNRKNPVSEKGRAIHKSRMSLIIALKTRLKERKSDLQNLGKTIREEYQKVIQRRIFTVTGIKLSDEVIGVIDTGSAVQMLENALLGISAEQMVAAVDEIKERHVAATDLNKKILEVQQKFEDMVGLVEAREEIDKALGKVRKLEKRARYAEEDLLDEREVNGLFFAIVAGLGTLLPCAFAIYLVVTSG